MRITLHAVSAADYRALLPALLPMFRASGRFDGVRRAPTAWLSWPPPRPRSRSRRAEASSCVTTLPASRGRLDTPVWWWVRRELPLVHVPEDGGWSFSRRPLITTASAWFGDPSLDDGGAVEVEAGAARRPPLPRCVRAGDDGRSVGLDRGLGE